MEQSPLHGLAKKMSATFGAHLISVVAYGLSGQKSLIVVFDQISESILSQQKKILTSFAKGYQEIHYFTAIELAQSTDVFPIEFLLAKETGQLLAGKDILSALQIEKANLRLQCEYELRTLTLKLRGAFFESKLSKTAILTASFPSLMRLLAASLMISGHTQTTLSYDTILTGISAQFSQDTTLLNTVKNADKKTNLDSHFDDYLSWINTFSLTLNDLLNTPA